MENEDRTPSDNSQLSIINFPLAMARWQMALVPHRDGTWDVLAGFVESWRPHQEARRVPFRRLPQAIAALAARCEAGEHGA